MKHARAQVCASRSEVSFDATLREEGSFSECGDRTFGQAMLSKAGLTLPELRRRNDPARRLLEGPLAGVAGKRKEIAWGWEGVLILVKGVIKRA